MVILRVALIDRGRPHLIWGYRELYIGAYETYKGLYEFNRGNTEYFDEGEAYDCTIGAVNKLLAGIYIYGKSGEEVI